MMNKIDYTTSTTSSCPDNIIVTTAGSFSKSNAGLFDAFYGTLIKDDLASKQQSDVYKRRPSILDVVPQSSADDTAVYIDSNNISKSFLKIEAADGRSLIIVDKNCEAKIFIDFTQSASDITRICEVYISENSSLEIVELHGGKNVNVRNRVIVKIARNGRLNNIVVCGVGANSDNMHKIILSEPGSQINMYGLSLIGGDDSVTSRTVIMHESGNCTSNQHYKSVVNDKAVSGFFGSIYVAKDAQQTVAYQQNNNILLSDTAVVDTKPQLEIYADDVKCNHGATIGELDAQAVYYMRQRGIPLDVARRLQIGGFVKDIVSKISDSDVKDYMYEILDENISKL